MSKKAAADDSDKFGLCKSTNPNWVQLTMDLDTWRKENPDEDFPKPQSFASLLPRWQSFPADNFRYRYNNALKIFEKKGKMVSLPNPICAPLSHVLL